MAILLSQISVTVCRLIIKVLTKVLKFLALGCLEYPHATEVSEKLAPVQRKTGQLRVQPSADQRDGQAAVKG